MEPKPPFWNLIAAGLPVAGAIIGIVLASSRGGYGDYAGRLGGAVIAIFIVAAAAAIGVGAAVASLMRSERMVWLAVLALIGNLAIALPVAGLLLRD